MRAEDAVKGKRVVIINSHDESYIGVEATIVSDPGASVSFGVGTIAVRIMFDGDSNSGPEYNWRIDWLALVDKSPLPLPG
jgi:hypothetical protein